MRRWMPMGLMLAGMIALAVLALGGTLITAARQDQRNRREVVAFASAAGLGERDSKALSAAEILRQFARRLEQVQQQPFPLLSESKVPGLCHECDVCRCLVVRRTPHQLLHCAVPRRCRCAGS